MSDIKCSAIACGYNRNRYCNKRQVNVEGLFSRSKLGTFCQSFKNASISWKTRAEMAFDMYDKITDDPVEVKVACSANYCTYNKNNMCTKDEITIGNSNAKYRSETECDSFKLR